MTAVLDWLRGVAGDPVVRERREKRAFAARLRRELPDYEARLSRAVEALEEATTEEIQAGAACRATGDPEALLAAVTRHELAQETRRLAGIAFDVARRQVNLRAGTLRTLEAELAETDEETTTR